ncbi:vacuolar protein sorting-associated protein 4A-like [Hibiscus syriacus]|uniref:Vacuolar protein sorting-associated protein 4A-like n=1 Tax=Hibiscus syriacus TaxID=106335 RepID=A0A6A3C8S1_HIBSY|nr:NDR1/HIN1-like protein 1 [Hibiscus syriacus]KAE8725144.1 vacuolar protein sorting-associated protein 4A-like [Hibiscus syriacus]
MGGKDCGDHGKARRKFFRRIMYCILIFVLLVLITIFLIWAILRPSKPSFTLLDTTVYAFNASAANFLTSNFQITLRSRNPNDDISIYYDRLDVYAEYRNQEITLRCRLPQTYQGHNEENTWSPFIYGTMVPVAPEYSFALGDEQAAGSVYLMIKVDGRLRWKVGTFVTGSYHIHVRCPAYITFGGQSDGVSVGENAVKFQFVNRCDVSL